LGTLSNTGIPNVANVARNGYNAFIMDMRLLFPELLESSGLTAYQVAKRSNKRISRSWAYRAKKLKGKLGTFGAVELEALCDVFDVEPGQLWERDKKRRTA
jgi:HPt (histidine-containing phosphotransfer) domain-containing protein